MSQTATQQQATIDVPICTEEGAEAPIYGSEGAAGADLRAHIQEDTILEPGQSKLIPTGLRMALPTGYELQVRPRSGLALKNQITVLNTPGTIDADYRGEIGIILINHGREAFTITPNMRVAQAVIAPVIQAHFTPATELPTTQRGAGGFGHTGVQ